MSYNYPLEIEALQWSYLKRIFLFYLKRSETASTVWKHQLIVRDISCGDNTFKIEVTMWIKHQLIKLISRSTDTAGG